MKQEPLTDEEIDRIIASNVTITDQNLRGAIYMAMREAYGYQVNLDVEPVNRAGAYVWAIAAVALLVVVNFLMTM